MIKVLNPSVQMILSFILSMIVLLTHSWSFNLAMTLYAIIVLVIFRQQTWWRVGKMIIGLSFITGIYFLTTYWHPNQTILVDSVNNTPLTIAAEIGSRIFALGMIGISLCVSIDKHRFIVSLIQQLKVPVSIAYSILVAINFLGLIKSEYEQAQLALRMRGFSGLNVYVKALLTMIVRLIRQSEYTATAMEARGFSGQRIQKISSPITSLDFVYILVTTGYLMGIYWFYQ